MALPAKIIITLSSFAFRKFLDRYGEDIIEYAGRRGGEGGRNAAGSRGQGLVFDAALVDAEVQPLFVLDPDEVDVGAAWRELGVIANGAAQEPHRQLVGILVKANEERHADLDEYITEPARDLQSAGE